MKKALWLLTIVVFALALGCTPGETEQQVAFQTYSMEQFMKTIAIGGGSFSPDESKLLVSSNETGVYNAYIIDIATGERTAATESTGDTVFAVGYFPNDDRILYTSDQGGNENNHLFLKDPDGTVTDLTQGENTKESFYGFSHDLNSFFTGNNSRDPKYFDVYEWNIETLENEMFYKNESGLNLAGMSNDKRYIALQKTDSNYESNIYLGDTQTGTDPVLITEHEGEINHNVQGFGPDGKYLYYTTDAGSDFMYVMKYDLETGEKSEVFRADWDVAFIYFSYNGKYRVIGTNDDGITKIDILDTESGEELTIADLPAGQISGITFSRSEKKLRFYVRSDNAPSNLYLYNLETAELKKLTDTQNPDIHQANMVASELIRYKARDGMEIPAYLYKPIEATADNKVPAMLWIHGGPGGQSRPSYNAEKQFLINHGYALFVVNNRGSSGYGKTFLAADDQKHGKEPLWDCVDAKDWLKENIDWIDPDKIGIMGGSYGGYMVMAALAFEPEEFALGVNIFGVTNWIRTLESIPPYWESFRLGLYREIGNPETDRDLLHSVSPLFHADKTTKPVMILQGANDVRVLQAESDDIVKVIQDKGGIVEYIVFDDEGHGFRKSENRIEGFEKVLKFLDKHFKGVTVDEAVDQ